MNLGQVVLGYDCKRYPMESRRVPKQDSSGSEAGWMTSVALSKSMCKFLYAALLG